MIIFLDCETTGLNPDKHEILSIGAVKEDGTTFECKVIPLHIKEADPKALEINGYKKEDWDEAFFLPHALQLLNDFVGTDMPYFMAYNASFDLSFLEKAYRDCNLPWPFHYHKLDLLTLAWSKLPAESSLSLKNVCLALSIEPEPAIHGALNGTQKAYEVYKKLTKNPL